MAYLEHTTDKLVTINDWGEAIRLLRLRIRDEMLQDELIAIFLFLDGIALIALIFMSGLIL